jgi:hypothetical protein
MDAATNKKAALGGSVCLLLRCFPTSLEMIVVVFLILLGFHKVFAFHVLLFLLFSSIVPASCPRNVTAR